MRFDELNFSKHAMLAKLDIEADKDTAIRLSWSTFQEEPSANHSTFYWLAANQKKTLKFFMLDGEDISKLRIDLGAHQEKYKIENFEIKIYDLYDEYKKALYERKKEPFVMTKFSQNHIEGTIEAAGDRMLFFSIPYSKGWKLTIDEERVPIEKVNVGFIGAKIGAGQHTVKLDYFLPGLLIGSIMTAVGCMIFIFLAWRTANISSRKNSIKAL
jgi:uncharacterized membrane protein YfhO